MTAKTNLECVCFTFKKNRFWVKRI